MISSLAAPKFSAGVFCLALGLSLFPGGRLRAQSSPAPVITLRIDPQTTVARLPADFLGFGYETSAVAQRDFFSVKNAKMVQLYRTLGPGGLVRIGGNVSDHTRYEPAGVAAPHAQSEVTVFNQANLTDLGEFLRATGWQAVWGLNLGTGSKEAAAEEAVAVQAALGARLHSFQIGNEINALPRFHKNYDAYHAAYLEYKAAVRAVLPHAAFSGPDVTGGVEWPVKFAETEKADLRLLTDHYYRMGANDPQATLESLLLSDPGWDRSLVALRQIQRQTGLDYRICETNSFYGGGKPGVSDTFGSTLWCLDFLLRSAAAGCSGVNLETDVNHLGWVSHYSPIYRDGDHYTARPEYYALLAFSLLGEGQLVKVVREGGDDANLTTYAVSNAKGQVWVVAINKDQTRDAELNVVLPTGWSSAQVYPLRAPAVDSKDRVTLAGTAVTDEGKWTPGPLTQAPAKDGACRIMAPRASAVLVQLVR